jgi:hypothetical protein
MSSASLLRGCVLLLGAGCAREASEPVMTPASRTEPSAEWATEQVTAARCDRELRCDTIGPEKEYPTRENCMRSLWSTAYAELDACYDGVDSNQLNKCLDEISGKSCGEFRLQAYPSCQLADLCVD